MEELKRKLPELVRAETLPEIPGKLRWKSKIFGKRVLADYIWNYYEGESRTRIPFYLPYIYMKENFEYLRRVSKTPKKQISMVLIDDEDCRTDAFLYQFLEELNFLTIVTGRREYFLGLQERAFQESGLLIELVLPWEEKNLRGNLVWDFTPVIQKEDCYPSGSVCFAPHKKEWKIREMLNSIPDIAVIWMKSVEASGCSLMPSLAESFLAPKNFPFRQSRCEELRQWCSMKKWSVKLMAETAKNLDI